VRSICPRPVPPSPSPGCAARTGTRRRRRRRRAPRRLLAASSTPAAAAPFAVRAPTMTKNEKKSFNQSLAEWKLFIYNPTTGEFLGRTAKSWGERRRSGQGRGGRGEGGGPGVTAAPPRAGRRPHSFLAGRRPLRPRRTAGPRRLRLRLRLRLVLAAGAGRTCCGASRRLRRRKPGPSPGCTGGRAGASFVRSAAQPDPIRSDPIRPGPAQAPRGSGRGNFHSPAACDSRARPPRRPPGLRASACGFFFFFFCMDE
jgi:hypothetical protein